MGPCDTQEIHSLRQRDLVRAPSGKHAGGIVTRREFRTEGVGLVRARGGEIVVIRPGDTVHTPPGEWHWHGAAPDHFMTHQAMSESAGDPAVPDIEWGEHVTDAEYRKASR